MANLYVILGHDVTAYKLRKPYKYLNWLAINGLFYSYVILVSAWLPAASVTQSAVQLPSNFIFTPKYDKIWKSQNCHFQEIISASNPAEKHCFVALTNLKPCIVFEGFQSWQKMSFTVERSRTAVAK